MALPRDTVTLSSEQFDKLVELLTPGYEMAKAMMEDRKRVEGWAEENRGEADDGGGAPEGSSEVSGDEKGEAQ